MIVFNRKEQPEKPKEEAMQWYCPECGNLVYQNVVPDIYDERPKYCPECGQKLDWSDYKEE